MELVSTNSGEDHTESVPLNTLVSPTDETVILTQKNDDDIMPVSQNEGQKMSEKYTLI